MAPLQPHNAPRAPLRGNRRFARLGFSDVASCSPSSAYSGLAPAKGGVARVFRVLLRYPVLVPACTVALRNHRGVPYWVTTAGDTLFAGSIGRTDLPGGSYEKIIRSLHGQLMALPDEVVVVPGHGPVTSIGEERETNPFITETRFKPKTQEG